MPRGNRQVNLSSRLAAIPKRGIVPSREIPGSTEWLHENKPVRLDSTDVSESFFENYSHEERQHYMKNCIPRSFGNSKHAANEALIDNINRWVDGNGWQYIEGGDYHGSWVNPRYPNKIFEGSSITLPTSYAVETAEFPVASNEDDTLGLACHYEVTGAGSQLTISPNKWIHYDNTRRGRKQRRSNERKARRQRRGAAFADANKIQNPEKRADAIAGLRAEFHAEDVKREQIKMGIEDM